MYFFLVASCALLEMAVAKLCLVLEDQFDGPGINRKTWKHEVTMSGKGKWEFEMYTDHRNNSFVKDGILYIMPTFTYDHMGPSMINGSYLDLRKSGCTDKTFYGCFRHSNGIDIINPIQSAFISTKNSATIKFGKVEVRAKLPTGDWIWPAIWMLPKHNVYGGWPASGEIDLMENRGNAPCTKAMIEPCLEGRDQFGATLNWGLDFHHNAYPYTHEVYTLSGGKTLADEYHIYGLLWTNTSLQIYIDDPSNVVLNTTLFDFFRKGNFPTGSSNPWPASNPAAPFDQEFYLILNVAVGGTNGYFPDFLGKPWKNSMASAAKDFWLAKDRTWGPTWPNDLNRAMAVDYVKMWREC